MRGEGILFAMTTDPTEQQLLDLLQPNEILSDTTALAILKWDLEVFEAVKQRLKAKGLVVLGRGRGGSISLVAAGQGAKKPESQKASRPEGQEAIKPLSPKSPEPRSQEAKKPKAPKATDQEPIEKQLWKTADKLRKNIDAAEYKHIVLGLVFLKYISDAFVELYDKLKAEESAGADPEDKDEYKAENVFFVPPGARWSFLQSHAKQPTIGKTVDEAMDAIERENDFLKGVLPMKHDAHACLLVSLSHGRYLGRH